jgi:hypothetical protein
MTQEHKTIMANFRNPKVSTAQRVPNTIKGILIIFHITPNLMFILPKIQLSEHKTKIKRWKLSICFEIILWYEFRDYLAGTRTKNLESAALIYILYCRAGVSSTQSEIQIIYQISNQKATSSIFSSGWCFGMWAQNCAHMSQPAQFCARVYNKREKFPCCWFLAESKFGLSYFT